MFKEWIFDPVKEELAQVAWDGQQLLAQPLKQKQRPLLPKDSPLLSGGTVLFASEAAQFSSQQALFVDIQEYIRKYVVLPDDSLRIAALYVLLSWVYDAFSELPYLRVRGDFGTGKTRFLLVVGALCYRATFAAGASTMAPIFHLLDQCRGSLVLDEADFRFSDEKSDMVKILNNGHVQGFPVLRCVQTAAKAFVARSFQVFGPKMVAMRGAYSDNALESRFVTVALGKLASGSKVPHSLPPTYKDEALTLRNQLLLFRLQHRDTLCAASVPELGLHPRLVQVYAPLFALAEDEKTRQVLLAQAKQGQEALAMDRAHSLEAQVLQVIKRRLDAGAGLSVGAINADVLRVVPFADRRTMTPRWMGHVLRARLGLRTQKRHGRFCVAIEARGRLLELLQEYELL